MKDDDDRWHLPRWQSGQESTCQCRRHGRHGLDLWVRKIPLEKEMATYSSIFDPMDRKAWRLPTPVFLPGKFHGPWSLTGDS